MDQQTREDHLKQFQSRDSLRMEAVVKFAAAILPNLEAYRAKNVNKYHRENELEFSEYTKLERYKNRVRIVDIFLEPLRDFLKDVGMIRVEGSTEEDIIE